MKFIGVYCGASERAKPHYGQFALELGSFIAKEKIGLVYGGGRLGLMGIIANSVIERGGQVVGYTTEHLDEREGAHPALNELYIVDTMHERKMKMWEKGDAFIILPGGFGTLDELFEVITWRQIKLHTKPIIILNVKGYWDPLKNLVDHIVKEQFAKEKHKDFIYFVSSAQEAVDLCKKSWIV